MTLQNFVQNKQAMVAHRISLNCVKFLATNASSNTRFDHQTLHCLFSMKFCSRLFLMTQNFEFMAANGMESNRLNLFLQTRGIDEQGLGHLIITSSSSHFFNETDLKQYRYLFNTRSSILPEISLF